jgi:hypothetical protein
MIKKRIKRALRAIGLVKPHRSKATALAAGGVPGIADARVIVRELYRAILKREADKEGCELFAAAMASGAMTEVAVVRALIESGEFALNYSRHPNVATALSAALLGGLMRTDGEVAVSNYAAALTAGVSVKDLLAELCQSPEFRNLGLLFAVHPDAAVGVAGSMISALTGRQSVEAAAKSYGEALVNGYPMTSFLDELCNSGEFRAMWGAGYSSLNGRPAVPSEIAQLAEELIAARLIGDGGILGLPPVNGLNRPPVAASQVANMIRTLDMLADRRDH